MSYSPEDGTRGKRDLPMKGSGRAMPVPTVHGVYSCWDDHRSSASIRIFVLPEKPFQRVFLNIPHAFQIIGLVSDHMIVKVRLPYNGLSTFCDYSLKLLHDSGEGRTIGRDGHSPSAFLFDPKHHVYVIRHNDGRIHKDAFISFRNLGNCISNN